MGKPVRILFLADSHLGIDLPLRPRVQRHRRGYDFLDNYARALQPAFDGDVDAVIHGGDVFDFPDAIESLAYQAYEPLVRVAESGIPVIVVPGNHERGRLPHRRFLKHPRVHVFDVPRTFHLEIGGCRIALSGFPYASKVRARFPDLLERTHWYGTDADVRLLCVHQCIEGVTIGPIGFMFTTQQDVIRCSDVPAEFDVVLSGHIHRQQVLVKDLWKRPLRAPVLYAGSIERTSIAEIEEEKGYMILEISENSVAWTRHTLPTRPMSSELSFMRDEQRDRNLELLLCDAG